MLSSLSKRSPVILRVFLTAVSALSAVVFASAFTLVPSPATATSLTPSPARPVSNTPLVLRAARAVLHVTVTVASGDTLSSLSQANCGTAADWSGLYAENKRVIGGNPDVITAGQVLKVHCYDPGYTWPAPPTPPPAPVQQYSAPAQQPAASSAPVPQDAGTAVSTAGDSSFQACVIARESGGNSQVMNSSGHYGLYQFSASTWAAYGGNPGDFGSASVSEQNQVFANAMASPGGASNWAPYDGC